MKSPLLALMSLLASATAAWSPYGRVEPGDGPTSAYYNGGTNRITSPENPTDWTKNKNIEGVFVDDDVTVEEMRYICRIPNLQYLQIGKTPEVIRLRPGVLDALAGATKLEDFWLNVDGLKKDDLKVFRKMPQLRTFTLAVQPNWDQIGTNESKDPEPLADEVGLDIAELENLEELRIWQSTKLADAFLKRLLKFKKLWRLEVTSENFSEDSLSILGKLNLRELRIGLPKVSTLSFDGLRPSPIRRLEVEVVGVGENARSKMTLSERAYESLLAMKNLETLVRLKDWKLEGANAEARMEQLARHLESNRVRNAQQEPQTSPK